MVTVSRHPLDRVAVRLFAASMLLSIASLAGTVALLWPRGGTEPRTPAALASGVHAASRIAPALPEKGPETPPEGAKTAPRPVAVGSYPVKMGETPSPAPAKQSAASRTPPLDFKLFNDEAVVWFDPQRLRWRDRVRVLTRLMLLPQSPTVETLLDGKGIPLLTPSWLLGRVRDASGQSIRYPYQAAHYAQTLLKQARRLEDGWLEVSVPLKPLDLHQRARRWLQPVKRAALDVDPALVLAIMEVESGFRERAVSASGAVGLMQLLPDQAARDVAERWGRPLRVEDLFDGQTNLRVGATYLSALQQDYLAGVTDPRSREYLTIAAYNGGIGAVLRLFGATPEAAVARINRLGPERVYRRLRYHFPRHETRRYLEKVLQARRRYAQWMKEHAV